MAGWVNVQLLMVDLVLRSQYTRFYIRTLIKMNAEILYVKS